MNIHHSIFSTTTVLYKKGTVTTARSLSTYAVSVQLTRFFLSRISSHYLSYSILIDYSTYCTKDILEYKGSDNQGKRRVFWLSGCAGAKCSLFFSNKCAGPGMSH